MKASGKVSANSSPFVTLLLFIFLVTGFSASPLYAAPKDTPDPAAAEDTKAEKESAQDT